MAGAAAGADGTEQLIIKTFQKFDQNGDGVINRNELTRVLKCLVKDSVNDTEIDSMLQIIDINKDGKIQYTEFVEWVMGSAGGMAPAGGQRATGGEILDEKSKITFKHMLPQRFNVDIDMRYNLDKLQLGEGGYGKVFIAEDKEMSGRRVAVKKVVKTDQEHDDGMGQDEADGMADLKTEIDIMKELDHPNICKLLATFSEGNAMYFVMELCEGGEVFDRIIKSGHVDEAMTCDIVKQVVSALCHAHNRGIAHRDIKPENVVFCTADPDDNRVKLIDWGLAISYTGSPMTAAVGSLTYAAPEVIQSKNRKQYTAACDIWSVGVLTYVMLSGKPPFWGTPAQHVANAKKEKYPMKSKLWEDMNPAAKDFIKACLKAEPRNRPKVDEVAQKPWMLQAPEPTLSSPVSKEVLSNLANFGNTSNFAKMCITTVARQLDHNALGDIHKVFRVMDKNGDGVLSLQEIKDGFLGMGASTAEVRAIVEAFEKLDVDGSQSIDYTEFCAAGLGQRTCQQDEMIWAAFKTFDTDNSGFINIKDIQEILKRADVQEAFCADVCDDVIARFDQNKDGKIDFREWKSLMKECWEKKRPSSTLTIGGASIDPYTLLSQVNQLSACDFDAVDK